MDRFSIVGLIDFLRECGFDSWLQVTRSQKERIGKRSREALSIRSNNLSLVNFNHGSQNDLVTY